MMPSESFYRLTGLVISTQQISSLTRRHLLRHGDFLMIQENSRKDNLQNQKNRNSSSTTDPTHRQTLPQQSLRIPDFFAPVPVSVLTSPEYNQLKAGARDCFVRMCMFRNTKERYLQRVIHQKTGQNFDLWDGTLKGRLTDKLVEMMGVAADTVRG